MKQKFTLIVWIPIVLVLVLVACGGRAASEPFFAEDTAGAPAEVAVEEEAAFEAAAEPALAVSDSPLAQIPTERLIIRSAELDIVVPTTQESLDEIAALAEELGGWVVNSSIFNFGSADRGNITIRVPAERFGEALDRIKDRAIDINSESTSGQDVTEEFVDLSARLENLEATADRVRGFLDESTRVEDALAVNQELSRLEEQIEVIKGRMQFLSQSAAFSTITVSLTPDELNQPIEVAGWRPQGVARDAIEALVTALQGLASFAIWLVIFVLPIVLIIGAPLYFVGRWGVRRWRRRRAVRRAAGASEAE